MVEMVTGTSFGLTADSAMATASRVNVGVRLVILVTSRAMGLASVALSALKVHLQRDWLKVIRTNAMSYSAEMVQLKSFSDGSKGQLVGQPVGILAIEASVAIRLNRPSPEPARVSFLDARPELLLDAPVHAQADRSIERASASPATVVRLAPATSESEVWAGGNATVDGHQEPLLSGVARQVASTALPHSLSVLRY